ncbi:ATP-binding protein [Bacillus sp. FJAT-45037]|uniref:ATP-binding protein n=1 Tax=Bacillus sp. FJAT-45037 TaxID=2011007 RepID=UPI000C23D7AD|nr:ATP-binding protein [Bacillus sp. FJAT-45037]
MVHTLWRARAATAQAFLGHDGTVKEVNEECCNLLALTKEQLIGQPVDEIYLNWIDQNESSFFQKIQNQKYVFFTWKNETDTKFTCKIELIPLNLGESSFLLQISEIDVKKKTSDQALYSQHVRDYQLSDKILHGIKDAIVTFQMDGTFLFVNEKAEEILGYTWDKLKHIEFWSFLQMDQKGLSTKIYELLAGEDSVEVEYFVEKTKCWYDVRVYRVEEQITLYFTNSTNRKRVEDELRASEKRYKSLVEHTPETISVHDGKELIYINPAGEKLFKANNQNELMNRKVGDLYKAVDYKRIRENARLLMSGKRKVTTSLFQLNCLDGSTVDVEATSTLILFRGKPAFRTILKDLSERKRMDDLIRKSDKLAVVAQLAAGVAHEIRNPLTAVKGFLQLFQRDKKFNEQFLQLVMEELERVESIIYEYLTLAKPNHESTFTELQLQKIIQKVMTLVETQSIMKNVTMEFEFEDVATVYGSEKQIKQVLLNLIRNALEAVEENGEITIRLRSHPEDQVCIQVEDNGCGIPKERVARLGEPFYSTKEKGTGLGMMVCYKIIEHHHGLMTVHSEVGMGTRIDVILPECEADTVLIES